MHRSRMLDPTLGRFVQRDPLGYVDGMTLYAYACSSPTVGADAEGLADFRPVTVFIVQQNDVFPLEIAASGTRPATRRLLPDEEARETRKRNAESRKASLWAGGETALLVLGPDSISDIKEMLKKQIVEEGKKCKPFPIVRVVVSGHSTFQAQSMRFGNRRMYIGEHEEDGYDLADPAVQQQIKDLDEYLHQPIWQFENCDAPSHSKVLGAFAKIIGRAVVGSKEDVSPRADGSLRSVEPGGAPGAPGVPRRSASGTFLPPTKVVIDGEGRITIQNLTLK